MALNGLYCSAMTLRVLMGNDTPVGIQLLTLDAMQT